MGKTLLNPVCISATKKHPHARGEDSKTFSFSSDEQETSPRLWGRRIYCLNTPAGKGNIPTPVGKTYAPYAKAFARQKHPHACGEDLRVVRNSDRELETSPRLWGRPFLWQVKMNRFGNIPTPVGKTKICTGRTHRRKKHPHACGEDKDLTFGVLSISETSPRLWGRQVRKPSEIECRGNIPTPVGKTISAFGISAKRWKHPHACGEDNPESLVGKLVEETSPRLWGRQSMESDSYSPEGNIPTPVGKTIYPNRQSRL